jgi:hypothetical protein
VEAFYGKGKTLNGEAKVFPAQAELVVTPRHAAGPPGATFYLDALARPEGTYRFQWEMEGETDVFTDEGKASRIAPAIEKEGKFTVTIKLLDLDGTLLDTDRVTVEVTKEKTAKPPGGGYWRLKEVVPKAHNLEDLKGIDPVRYNNAKFFCGTNFSSSATINRSKASIAYTGTIEKRRGGETERVDLEASWIDPGDIIRPGKITLTVSSKEKAGTKLFQDDGFGTSTSAGFSRGDPEGHIWPLGARGGGLPDMEGYSCQAFVYHGKEPSSAACTLTPEIPEGEEGIELHFNVEVGSPVGQAKLTMKYVWQPTPN